MDCRLQTVDLRLWTHQLPTLRGAGKISDEMLAVELPADVRELPRLTEFCGQAAGLGGLSAEHTYQLEVVLEELFVNVAHHAVPTDGALRVRIEAAASGAGPRLRVVFRDNGGPYDPTLRPEPDTRAPLADREPGGLGIHFVRKFTTALEYRYGEGWNVLSFQVPSA